MRQREFRFPGVCRKNEIGFTLIELLCVIALLGMIALMATPVVANMSRSRNLEVAAQSMAMDMRKAQQKAITAGWSQLIEMRESVNDYRIKDGKTGARETVKLPEGVRYNSINFPRVDGYHLLSFNRRGAPNSGGTVALTDNSGKVIYVIVTPATGRVRISEEPPANW